MYIRLDLITLSLLMMAGIPALAHGQACNEAEAKLRTDAAQLGSMFTQMGMLSNEFLMKQQLIQSQYDDFAFYDEVPETSEGSYIGNLEREKAVIQQNYDRLAAAALPLDAKVAQHIKDYEVACGANANTGALLKEYEIVAPAKPQGQ